MKLWILENKNIKDQDFDICMGFVVRAKTEQRARELANERDHDCIWSNSECTTCEELTKVGEEEVVIRDYRAG